MSLDDPHMSDSLTRGRQTAEALNPGMEQVLSERYDDLLPDFAETVVDMAYGRFYSRDGLDAKTRHLCTVAALTALGAQTAPQLKVNIASARKTGASQREIAEAIMQMGLYGGFPAMINGLNAAKEVFAAEETS